MIRISIGAAAVASLALAMANPPYVYASQQDGQETAAPAKAASDARESFATLRTVADTAMQAWQREQMELSKAAKEAGEEFQYQPFDFGEIREKAMKLVGVAEPDLAAEILVWVLQSDAGNSEGAGEVLEILSDKHAASPALEPLVNMLPFIEYMVPDADKAAGILLKFEKGTTIPLLRGHAMMARMKPLMAKADRASAEYAAMKAALSAGAAEIGDADFSASVESFLKRVESYGVGCVAPDISGVDLDGVEFKLSDYRGKVVFLDFWGDW